MNSQVTTNDPYDILVVEDDASLNEIVRTRLARDGHNITSAFSGTEAKLLLAAQQFDLVITDLMLPGMPGEDIVSIVRAASSDIPIIVVSAKTATSNKIDLLKLGADDYLAKPFDLDELSARVYVQLRHTQRRADTSGDRAPLLHTSGLIIDSASRTISIAGHSVELTRTEFDILELLSSHPQQVFTKQSLYEHVWHEPYLGQDSTVNAHISNLRNKLKAYDANECIQTVWGLGFRFVS